MARKTVKAQFVVRNLEPEVKRRLQKRALRHGRSMEDEVRDILRNAVKENTEAAGGLGTAIARLFADCRLDSEIPELRGQAIEPVSFDE
ncbi:MAG TPA: Arc family DNA-binding protein [Terriglobales bacterium]|jgi:antitoxin FitA|nr:Arc family DNA-binding protein [Terriglobales bacterium]